MSNHDPNDDLARVWAWRRFEREREEAILAGTETGPWLLAVYLAIVLVLATFPLRPVDQTPQPIAPTQERR